MTYKGWYAIKPNQLTNRPVDKEVSLVWRGMLQGEGRRGQFPYPSLFESTDIRIDR